MVSRIPPAIAFMCAGLLLVAAARPASAQSTRPGLGSTLYADAAGTGVTFRVWAPNATSVGVKGQFNGWATTALAREGATGYWSRDIAGARVGQEYKVVVNGNMDRRDPRSRRVTNSAGNSVITDPNAFDWGGITTVTPPLNDLIIYELHAGTFNAEAWVPSTFDQCIAKLDHLERLGISAVQVMPPFEYAGDKSWGYNPADPFAIESSLGGPDAFRRFIKACHERGIAVLVDVVHNHYGPSDLSMWQFDGWSQNGRGGIYFFNDFRATTLWGDTRPDFSRPEVRDYIRDNIRMLLDEYRVGGFRWDSVFSILYASGTHLPDGEALLRDINWLMQTGYPGRIRIAEDHAFDFNMNFQSQWDVGFHDHLKWQVTRTSDADRNMAWLADRIAGWGGHQRVIFSESHDTVGALNQKHRLPRDIDPTNTTSIWARKRQLLAASIVMTTPGVPMLFQGQEMHEDWDFAAETALRWSLTNTWAGIVDAYADLIRARRNLRGGTQGLKGTGVVVHHKDDLNKVIGYVRWDAGGGADDVVVVANFSSKRWTNGAYSVEFPAAGTWYAHVNTDSKEYGADFGGIGGSTVIATGSPARAAVDLGMYAARIFSRTPPVGAGVVAFSPAQPAGCVPLTVTYNPTGSPLAAATQIVAVVAQNNWQFPFDVPLTNVAGEWTATFPIPIESTQIDVAFHDGASSNRVWDNNEGRDWSVPVTGCANLPSAATISPPQPRGCVPVVVTYEERSGPLKNATNVVLFLGRNDWRDLAEVAMKESPSGVWVATQAVADATWQLDFVFHNGALTNRAWDNNNGQDWRAFISDCIDPLEPSVTITNPPADIVVSNEVTAMTVSGTAGPGIADWLQWTNTRTGQGSILLPAATWSIPSIALAEGVNVIRVSGTNSPMNPNRDSRDAATNATYTSSALWVDGMDGGVRWGGPWRFEGGPAAGHFLAQAAVDPTVGLGSHAWGLWANSSGLSAAVRPLAARLGPDDVLRVRFENGFIDTASSVGIGLQNRFGQNLFEFLFIGGDTNYVINDSAINRGTGIPFTDGPLDIEFQLTTPSTYRFAVSGFTFTGAVAVASESVIDRFRVWNYSAGGGSSHNVYLTDLAVEGPSELPSVVYQDEVSITRRPGPFSDADGDGYATWEEEFAGTDPDDSSSFLPEVGAMLAGRVVSVAIRSTTPARWYDVYRSTNLLGGVWSRVGAHRQGSGAAVTLWVTNDDPVAVYRTGVFDSP